jgi:ATPase complex subunit ATP10
MFRHTVCSHPSSKLNSWTKLSRPTDGKGHTGQMTEGNVSIIAITNSQISQEHVKTWTQDVAEKWRSHERFRFVHVSIQNPNYFEYSADGRVQVNLQQNPLRTFLVSMFTSRLRQEVPRYFHQVRSLNEGFSDSHPV